MATNELQLSDGRPEGVVMGQSASDLVAFHGSEPTDQIAAITSVSTTAATASSPVGFATTTQADAIVTAVNAVLVALREKGIIAS